MAMYGILYLPHPPPPANCRIAVYCFQYNGYLAIINVYHETLWNSSTAPSWAMYPDWPGYSGLAVAAAPPQPSDMPGEADRPLRSDPYLLLYVHS